MPLNNLALFVLIAVVIFLVLLTIFILLRLVSSARRM